MDKGFLELLFIDSEENPPLEEQLYLYMKRFRTQPSEFFGLERKLRLKLYKREMELLNKEYEEVNKSKARNAELESKNK